MGSHIEESFFLFFCGGQGKVNTRKMSADNRGMDFGSMGEYTAIF